jgi:hypothetical protein
VKQKPGVAVTMPREWPPVTDSQAQALYAAAKTILDARTALVQPSEKRFIDQTSQYCVRAFVRVRSEHADCPPQTWWSDCSDPFVIAPWYDSSGVPPVQIVLPDATNMDLLKSLKPNVAFQVPKNLFNMLQNTKLKDLAQGTPPSSGGMTIDWICGFNIPIITLCAFIVLNIFLQLLDIVFFWMFIVKICIPIPRKK